MIEPGDRVWMLLRAWDIAGEQTMLLWQTLGLVYARLQLLWLCTAAVRCNAGDGCSATVQVLLWPYRHLMAVLGSCSYHLQMHRSC
jgi:hypothetical protein